MTDKKEIEHHIREARKLLTQGRFTIQEVNEKLSFLMGDLHIVLDRMKSIFKSLNTEIQESDNRSGEMQQRIAEIDTPEKKHGLYCDKCGELRTTVLVTMKEAMHSSGLCADCKTAPDPSNYEIDHALQIHCPHTEKRVYE